jgi:hypothetical protein
MPSAHYEASAAYLRESMGLLTDAAGEVKPENRPVWNICNAILALSDALQDEFIYLNTRLNYLEHRQNR